METPENQSTEAPDHPNFAKYEAKHPDCNPDCLFHFEPPAWEWLKVGAAITVDGEPATVIRYDEQLHIVEFRHGDC